MRLDLAYKFFLHLDCIEAPFCVVINRIHTHKILNVFFLIINSLGNGKFWYILMILLPFVYGKAALLIAFQMIIVGLFSLPIYKFIKNHFARNRPYITHKNIVCVTPPLDHYSFPTGHTMNAVAFTIIVCKWHSELGTILIPFTFFVALSSIELGHHYPTDIIFGAFAGIIFVFILNFIWIKIML